jgi:hypothetical protein
VDRRQAAGLFVSVGAPLALAVVTLLLGRPTRAALGDLEPGPGAGGGRDADAGAAAARQHITPKIFLPLACRAEPINFWSAQYYDNDALVGSPVHTAEEQAVDYDWGDGGPPGLPANHFSARWAGDWAFEGGEYTFFLRADDGARFWLDDTLLIDRWSAGQGDHQATVIFGESAVHRLRLEYFEQTGLAAVRLHWRRSDLYPPWQAKYYANAWLNPPKSRQGSDSAIQFDWEMGAPDDLPADWFSAAWQATPLLPDGTQEIFVYADEGYQLLIDGNVVQEGGWDDPSGGAEDDSYLLHTASGVVQIGFHAHDQGGPAEARLWIVHAGQPPWSAEFYDNRDLSGLPVKTRTQAAVFHDWGLEQPTSGVPNDRFSVRWTALRYFHAGAYRFGVFADDGVRLRLDGQTILDAWGYGRAEHHPTVRYLTAGYHELVVEYFENVGEAEIRLWWE